MATPPEENTAIVQRFWEEVFNQGNLEVADELIARDHVLHQILLPEEKLGPDVVKYVVLLFHNISPDIQVITQDEIAEGDKVMSRWRATGTLAPELRSATGVTGEVVRVLGMSVFRVSDGEIKETWQQLEEYRDESEAPMPRKEVQELLYRDQRYLDLIKGGGEQWRKLCCIFRWCC